MPKPEAKALLDAVDAAVCLKPDHCRVEVGAFLKKLHGMRTDAHAIEAAYLDMQTTDADPDARGVLAEYRGRAKGVVQNIDRALELFGRVLNDMHGLQEFHAKLKTRLGE